MGGSSVATTSVDEFLATARPSIERALIARFGLGDGLDAAADAVEYAVANWDRVGAMENPTGYLFTVGRTRATRAARRADRLTALVAEPITTDSTVDVDLQAALMRLPWEQRVAVMLVHAHGHTYASAAEIMDMPVSSISNHLNRGLARLRTEVGER